MNKINKTNGLIISSGYSERMGEPKALLDFYGKPFLIEIARKLLNVCSEVIVVLGYKEIEIKQEIEKYLINLTDKSKLKFIFNPDYSIGMFTSIQAGLKELKNSGWIIYHMIDQPDLPEQFYREFIQQIDNEFDWIQPEYNSKRGHPVLIRSSVFNMILNASKEDNLRNISSAHFLKRKTWNCKYKQIFTDIDTPEDYYNLIRKN